MTFPSVNGRATSSNNSSSPMAATLPTGIVVGELLLAICDVAGNGSVTTPTGWTSLLNATSGTAATDRRLVVFYRTADGTEGSSVSIANSLSSMAVITLRISGWKGTPAAATATGGTTSPDPPSLSPSWGSADTLWIAAAACRGTSVSVFPSGFSNTQSSQITGGVNSFAVSAELDATTATEDPGTFTQQSNNWAAATIAIQPVSIFAQSVSVGTTTSVSLGRSIGKVVAVSLTGSVSIARAISKNVAVASTSTTSVLKSIAKTVAAATTTSVAFSAGRAFLVSIGVGVSSGVSFVRTIGKVISASLAGGVTVRKVIAKTITVASSLLTSIRRMASNLGRAVRSVMFFWH